MNARGGEKPGFVDRIAVPAIAIVSVAGWLLAGALLLPRADTTEDWLSCFAAATAMVPALLGWRMVHLLPGNIVGRRLALLGLALTWLWIPGGLGFYGAVELQHTGALWVRWITLLNHSSFILVFLAMAGLVLVFPNGQYASRRWRHWAWWVNRVIPAVVVLLLFDGSDLTVDGHPEVPAIVSPLPSVAVVGWFGWPVILFTFGWLIAAALCVRRRFMRSTGIERLQLSWLAYASALIPIAIATCLLESAVFDGPGVGVVLAIGVTTVALPAAIAAAVLRYRLYDIERLVNRTLLYLALTATLGIAYAAVAILVGMALGGGTGWSTAAGTLAVAVGFRPVRDRLQQAVDRRFAKRRYEGLRLVEGFLDDVRAGRDEPERIGEVLARALGDNGLEVYFRLPASGGFADASGRLTSPPTADERTITPVRRGDLELGLIVHDPNLDLRADTFESIVRAAGLAIEIARLRVEVRVQLAEVEASRGRIVAATDAERRKLERDLHDGAQQRLVALGMALRQAQGQLDHDPGGARDTLDRAVGEVTTAVVELRQMARGLRPGVLDSGGLAGALTDVAARSPVPVALEITREPLPPQLEAVAFFLACESVTNAIKHAGAHHIRIRVDRRGELLLVEVADDGVGGARLSPGGGVAGMTQRAMASGGTLAVDSPPGGGTTIRADLPVGLL